MAGGRPEGSLKDPETSYKQELLAWTSVARTTRKMIERQLAMFDSKLADVEKNVIGFSIEDQLAIMAGLASLLNTAVRTAETGLKVTKGSGNDKPSENPEELMQELEGGKGA